MGFLKRLFGGKQDAYVDRTGIYLYAVCDNCGDRLRVRVDKQHDLNRQEGGFIWRKTLVDNKCYRPMPTVVHFDGNYDVVEAEIEGGRYLSQEEYEARAAAEKERQRRAAEKQESEQGADDNPA